MRRKAVLAIVLLTASIACLTGCKEKVNQAYLDGQAQASAAFEVKGNTTLDEDKQTGNLGIAASEKLDSKGKASASKDGSSGTGQSETGSTAEQGTVYEYYVNTDTFQIHTRDCIMVDLKVPTFERWEKSIEEAEAAGYTRCPECLR